MGTVIDFALTACVVALLAFAGLNALAGCQYWGDGKCMTPAFILTGVQ